MKYTINKENFHDFKTFSVNRLDARTYFIPYPDRESADRQDAKSMRYNSPEVICLSGDWDFKFYPVPSDLPDILDTDEVEFDAIDVPSCWQFRGYDKPFYVNARYQFPYDPPKIPETEKCGKVFSWFGADHGVGPRRTDPGDEYNFVGVYRRYFDISDSSKRYIISFLGIASCADVYVNGGFCGYSEGSHNTAEFDISGMICDGRNELVVVVHRWCTGTYLECQDMFRNNGIFRDVLLRACENGDVFDIDFRTAKGDRYSAVIKATLLGDSDVSFTLSGHGLDKAKTVKSEGGTAEVSFNNLIVKEWNAETPYLYDLYVETPASCVKLRVGFKDVKIRNRVFLLNGKKLKLHGVNHHDTSPVNGYAMTPDEIERDIKLCKEYNIDTIRTSHYPPDPLLLQLCDELGIYVIDEADLETHGSYFQKLPPSYNRLSNDPKWAGHYVDRIKAMYGRDKTHASIIMWSLGNESGGTFNTDLMYMYLKDNSGLPVQYESAVHTRRKAYDVGSEMYPPVKRLHEIGRKRCKVEQLNDRPYFMCEYAHAMGVGPGGMEDYWKEIYLFENLMGGCVWEMNDHAVLHEDGSYTYGGDHGEWEHDGNFCVDGLFYPDRRPSTGAKIAAFVYRPLHIRYVSENRFDIFNTRSFINSKQYMLSFLWSDGSQYNKTFAVNPLSVKAFNIETVSHIDKCRELNIDCTLTVITKNRFNNKEIAREQLIIEEAPCEHVESAQLPLAVDGEHAASGIMMLMKDGKPEIRVNTENDSEEGFAFSVSDPYTILFRAPTDNDFTLGGAKNLMAPFLAETEKVLSVKENTDGQTRTVTVKTKIKCRGSAFICTDVYECSSSQIIVSSTLHCTKVRGLLPRFGKAFRLDSSFDKVEYYGRNGESYADMKDQAQIDHVTCSVSDMTEPNIRPQESGNRADTRWASLSDGRHTVMFTALDKPFELGVKPYSDRELVSMKHCEDEKTTGTYITISAFQQGIGTGICGPGPSPECCYSMTKDYYLKFRITMK